MGKKRSSLRSTSKGINNTAAGTGSSNNGANNNKNNNKNTHWASSASSSSSSAIPATHADSSSSRQQQQLMQSLFQVGNSSTMPSTTTSADAAEKWAFLTEMVIAGTNAAAAATPASGGNNNASGIIFPGGGGEATLMMCNNTNSSSSGGMMMMMSTTAATGNSSHGNHRTMIKMARPEANNATIITSSSTPNDAAAAGGGSAQAIGLQLEALAALMAQQQNNPALKISVTSSSGNSTSGSNGGGLLTATSGNGTNNKHSGKKRSSRNTTAPTTTTAAAAAAAANTSSLNHGSVNITAPMGKMTAERMKNFQQYLKVIADSYQQKLEQEQKDQTEKQQQQPTTSTTTTTATTATTSSRSRLVSREHHGDGGNADAAPSSSPNSLSTKNDNESNAMKTNDPTVAPARAPTTTTNAAKRKQSPNTYYPRDNTTATNTNFDPSNHHYLHHNNNNNNNSTEELQSLLPIFAELVSLTNKIVAAQENGDVAQVDAATSQLCQKVLKDEQAMSMLGVAMKEMNNNKQYPKGDGCDGDDNGDGVGRSSNGLRTTESHAFVEGNDVAAGLNDLLHGISIYGSTTTTTNTASSTRSKNNGGASTRSPATRKEEMERRRTNSMLAEKNEAIRKLAALGASMQTNGTTASESAGGGGAGTPTFSFTFGGESSSTSYPNTSTSSGIGPMPPPFFVPSVGEAAVPPPFLPPPPGGWPPNTAQAAAAAAAVAAFSSSVGYACPGLPGAPSPTFADTSAYLLSDPCLRQIPIPIVSVGGSLEMLNSAEWSEYFDAYLRDRGVNGGLQELARLSSQGAAMTASMSAEGGRNNSSMASGAPGGRCPHPVLPQDRFVPHGLGDKDDVDYIPAGFEYDESRNQSQKSLKVDEEELRTKRAAKKRDKKARQKERAKKEAEVKAALAAMKKREKAITSWRSRVVAACSAGDSRRMEVLVEESPFKNYVYDPKSFCYDEENDNDDHDDDGTYDNRPKSHEEYISKQMEWFLSNCLQKYRYPPSSSSSRELSSKQEQPHEQNIARKALAEYILSVSFEIVLQQSPSSQNRNAIHSAAYMDDVDFIRWVILRQSSKAENDVSYLECRCLDGGWTPLHYATAGGAKNVVEVLLHAGVCVTARTDSSLTCFKSRRGNGITARELAIALQSGAVKDKIMSESGVLRNIVKYQLGNASTDKVAYLKNLYALETLLANVEKYGYSPLLEKADDGYQGNRVLVPAQTIHSVDVQRSTSASTSQTSKKKKKQQQQARANTKSPPLEAIATCSNSNSAPSTVKDEDFTDPVAVALLGMGFSDDQIKSAARALGGFERATADDMVAWILGEGKSADSGNSPNASNDNQSASLSETQEKSLPRANDDQPVKASNAELAARKRQEEIAAAKRALEKREEQRRIRREWNEREQARQMQEKSAKIAAAVSRRHEVKDAKLAPELGVAGVGVPPSTVSVASIGASGDGIGKKHHHDAGPPLTIFAGGPKSMSAKSKNVASSMGIPQAPTLLRTPKILTRPLHPPAHSMPQSLGAAGNQPLFAPSPSLSSAKPSSASPPRNIFAQSIHPSISNPRNDQPTAILRKESSAGVAVQGINTKSITRRILPRNSGHLGTSGLAINDSESLGASTSVANSASTQILRRGVAPPGFVNGGSTHHRLKPSATEEAAGAASSSSFVETNPLGMIRATAREFVPTYFNPSSTTSAPPDSFLPVLSNTVPSMSAQFMSSRPSTTSPPPLTRTESNDDLMFEHVSSLLSTFGAESSTPTVQSVTSSITGPSGMVTTATTNNNMGDENKTATSRVGSIIGGPFAGGGGGGSGIQTSSIFESISYHGNRESNNLALGSGIWGTGSSTVNQSSSIGLAGLNLSSFMGGV